MAHRRPLLLFAPGAGAASTSPWMEAWASRLSTLGRVERFNYAYARAGRRAPDRLPKLVAAHGEALLAARGRSRAPVVLIGKSMGSRVGCHLTLEEDITVDALVCLGYPLKGAGKKATIRDQVLVDLRVPILFVQGSRDPLCPLDLLKTVRPRMQTSSHLHVVEGGNHSLVLSKRQIRDSGVSQEASDAAALEAIREFLGKALN